MIITPVANCLTGIAASCVLLSSEVTVVDVAKDAMALFFINRLDEDFGSFHTMTGVVKRRLGWMNPKETNEEDEEIAEMMLTDYGPWTDIQQSTSLLFRVILACVETILFVSAFVVPFLYFGCAM